MIQTFIEGVSDDQESEYIICVTGDHTTPTLSGDHTYEPVPILMSLLSNFHGNTSTLSSLTDSVSAFNEISCSSGSLLGRFQSRFIMPTLLKLRQKVIDLKNQ